MRHYSVYEDNKPAKKFFRRKRAFRYARKSKGHVVTVYYDQEEYPIFQKWEGVHEYE